jgi:hypothetical protein
LSFFESIVIHGSRYDYTIRQQKGDFGGYRLDEDYQPVSGSGEGKQPEPEEIDEEQLERGWYLAGLQNRRTGTPENWVWVRRLNLEAFVNPGRLREFASKFDLSTIIDEEYERDSVRMGLGFGFSARF